MDSIPVRQFHCKCSNCTTHICATTPLWFTNPLVHYSFVRPVAAAVVRADQRRWAALSSLFGGGGRPSDSLQFHLLHKLRRWNSAPAAEPGPPCFAPAVWRSGRRTPRARWVVQRSRNTPWERDAATGRRVFSSTVKPGRSWPRRLLCRPPYLLTSDCGR